ncbi:MAG: hypothetical protein QNJ64_02135 [Crocosphaera sp.]|nr:hypothetical protein [Crocosphaera sp.]
MILNLLVLLKFFPWLTGHFSLIDMNLLARECQKTVSCLLNSRQLYHSLEINSLSLSNCVNWNKKPLLRGILIIFFSLTLTACKTTAVPLEFAPDGQIVRGAISLQLEQRLNPLSEQLNVQKPNLDISNINVKNIDTVIISNLPSYHLTGTYNLKLNLLRQQVKQKENKFDLYLQRQAEGKTWRLLSKDNKISSGEVSWKSYLIMEK